MSPPYTITPTILRKVAEIGELVGRLEATWLTAEPFRLRRENRILTVQASLAIEGNSLDLDQVTAVFEGRRVMGPAKDVQEIRNALKAYELVPELDPFSDGDLCRAHQVLMHGLVDNPGRFRQGGVGIRRGEDIVHVAPGADRVPFLVSELLKWLRDEEAHALIKSAVFHYELEFIHPFADGNGRLGRLWQTLLLHRWKPFFLFLPIESVVESRQVDYYAALRAADAAAEATPFIDFMLEAVRTALVEVAATDPVTDLVTDPVTDQVSALLRELRDGAKGTSLLMKMLSLSHRPTFRANYLKPALEGGLVEMTVPSAPSSSRQQYRLTDRGRRIASKIRPVRRPGRNRP